MSLFVTTDVPCPACGTIVPFEMVHSVNADRRPDLKDAIIGRSFQKQACPGCEFEFRVEPEFNYIHIKGRQWIAAWSGEKLRQWKDYEVHAMNVFALSFGPAAPKAARELGAELAMRVTFGWPGLREKLVAAAAGINDGLLELAKMAIIRTSGDSPITGPVEFRLLGASDTELVLGWVRRDSEELIETVFVPRTLLSEIEADTEAWGALQAEINGSPYVDLQRLITAPPVGEEPVDELTADSGAIQRQVIAENRALNKDEARMIVGIAKTFLGANAVPRPPRFCVIAGHPVKLTGVEGGGMDITVLSLESGRFGRDMRFLERAVFGTAGVEIVTEEAFNAKVLEVRNGLAAKWKAKA